MAKSVYRTRIRFMFFALLFSALLTAVIPASAYNQDVQCKDIHVLVERMDGRTVCLTVQSAEVLAERLGWIIIADSQSDAAPYMAHYMALNSTGMIISKDVSKSNNAFAMDFYDKISDNDNNIFFSPISMHMAFSALYEGARGETAEQIRDVFGLESDDALRAAGIASAISSINRDDPLAELGIANALWLFDYINESYATMVRDVYRMDTSIVGLNPAEQINTWASENTNGKIPEIVSPRTFHQDLVMIMTNAIYFKGSWLMPFEEADTYESDFWTDDEKSVSTDFMFIEHRFGFADTDDALLLRMPYKGDRLSMLLILPHERGGIEKLEEIITPEKMTEWSEPMFKHKVKVTLPKFTINSDYDLKKILKSLGMPLVFDGGGDLSGIAPYTFVNSATHNAFVLVNEKGTEAAAATSIQAEASGSERFTADHPFIFIIQDDESGAILFMGRVSDPTA